MHIKEIILEHVSLSKEEREEVIRDFIEFTKKKLYIKTKFHINFSYDVDAAQNDHRTGSFNAGTHTISVYMHKRNLVDILRTIGHELTHVKQEQDHRLPSETGPESKEEAEAAAVAGWLIKLYGGDHHHIYE